MRYSGKLGISEQTEVRPGVWEDVTSEVDVLGEVKQKTDTLVTEGSIHPIHRTTTSVSVFARGLGPMDNSVIKYVTYAGKRWTPSSIVDSFPRIIIYIGEEYHGPAPQ